MKLFRISWLLFCSLAAPCPAGEGGLKLFPLFTDHGILQQDTTVPIWGTAIPGKTVVIEFCNARATATADEKGEWLVRIKTPKAESGKVDGYDLAVVSEAERIVLHDVAVGEVWIGSGQSNIDTMMNVYSVGKAEIPRADYPGIRIYSAGPGRDVKGDFSKFQWNRCNPETAAKASAAGYFFSRELHKALNVPVGFINMAVGGSPLSAWVKTDWLAADPRMAANMETFRNTTFPAWIESRKQLLAKWEASVAEAKAKGEKPAPAWPPFQGAADQPLEAFIGGLHDTHTAMVMPFVFKGMLWDQGESGVGYALKGNYDDVFDIMLRNLRKGFGYDLPVVYCQMPKGGAWGPDMHTMSKSSFSEAESPVPLADLPSEPPKAGAVFESFAKESDPFLRMNGLPSCHMAVTRDLGAALHPPDKDAYGARFCLTALDKIYGRSTESSGPMITSAKRVEGTIHLGFDHVGSGLVALGGRPLQGFYVTSANGKSAWAPCRIEGNQVILTENGPDAAVTVSYAHTNGGRVLWANLFNKEGIPAHPMTVKIQ